MVFIDPDQVEILKELPREIPNTEILGRRLYNLIAAINNNIILKDNFEHWGQYTVIFPPNSNVSFHTLGSIDTIEYTFNPVSRELSITMLENISALDVRKLAQHVESELFSDNK
jgi:hypothetical protein